jgi:hypothetical protein
MNVLFYGAGLILVALFIHLVIWKISIPRNQIKALLTIFLATFAIGVFIISKAQPLASICEYLQLFFFFTSLTLAYITTYPALEVDSPSLVIVIYIIEASPEGLDRNTLEQEMNNDILVAPRLRDLITANLAFLDGNNYKPTKKGVFLARLFITYRKLLKKTQKGG